METLPTNVQTIDLREPIPGYVLGERLGAGGFGEVWRAAAPGGLPKAVKIVYGQMQDDRAGQELRALERIKDVRHPMLLSFERIETIAENLVIVMELADGSLRGRQAEYEAANLPGIPRDELLRYLGDAADGLDYLVEQHALLHLDVKPENLLLIADRVKVADFGLMRAIDDIEVSLAGGMTPLYTAPEVIDGKPHRQSDQYSLAIVYQELLTGTPPFAGRTAAQLISQHLHSPPDLKALPTFDQPVIARALSKDPERRFSTSRALVDELVKVRRVAERAQPRRAPVTSEHGQSTWRGATLPSSSHSATLAKTEPVSLALPVPATVQCLPPITLDEATQHAEPLNVDVQNVETQHAETLAARPALFIGVGGIGTRVLCQLKHRLAEKFGNIEATPAWQFLALETDPQSLAAVSSEDYEGGLRFHESVLLPLQDSRDYRAKSNALLEWMNRRWLYNIPRSKRTEGIRALGRLAFVDHFGVVVEALHTMLTMTMAHDSLASSSQSTGIRFTAGPPRVYVVGSTTGGTGSGIVLDLGYTLRTLLGKMNVADEHLCGILACAIPSRAKARDLAVANTVALLGELKQFTADRFPGEPACDLPAFDAQAPFTNTYFVHQPELSDDAAMQASVNDVSEYLLANAVAPAATFFDRCRQSAATPRMSSPVLTRSFGIDRMPCQTNHSIAVATDRVVHCLLARWSDESNDGQRLPDKATRGLAEKANGLAAKFAELFGLDDTSLVDEVMARIGQEIGQDPLQYIRQSAHDVWGRSATSRAPQRRDAVIRFADRLVETPREAAATNLATSFAGLLDLAFAAKRQQIQTAMRDWLAKLVDTPGLRFPGARFTSAWLVCHFEGLEQSAATAHDRWAAEVDRLRTQCADIQPPSLDSAGPSETAAPATTALPTLVEYALARLQAASYQRTLAVWQEMRTEAQSCQRRIQGLLQSMKQFADEKSQVRGGRLQESNLAYPAGAPSDRYQRDLSQLVATLDCELAGTSMGHLLFLAESAAERSETHQRLVQIVCQQSQSVVRRHFREAGPSESPGESSGVAEGFAACVDRAVPPLISLGGARRTLVTVPGGSEFEAASLSEDARLASESVTILTEGDGEVRVCFEIEQIPLDNIAASLIRNRTDYLELAARLHTRIDVDWRSFDSLSKPSESAPVS